jgi:hypothetical protein
MPIPASEDLSLVNSTLMQNYWDEKPVNAAGSIQAVYGPDSVPMCFTVGTGGSLYRVQPSSPGRADWGPFDFSALYNDSDPQCSCGFAGHDGLEPACMLGFLTPPPQEFRRVPLAN